MPENSCWICRSIIGLEDNFCRNCGAQLTRVPHKIHRTVPRSDSFLAVGIFMTVAGVIIGVFSFLMNIIPLLALGLGAVFLGVMTLFLPESTSFRADRLVVLFSLPSLMNTESLIEDLDVSSCGVYIPTTGFGVVPKVFLPMVESDSTEFPQTQLTRTNRVFVTVGLGSRDRGILLDPPGAEIVTALENCLQMDFAMVQADDLGGRLNFAFEVLGIAKRVVVRVEVDVVNVEMQLVSCLELEQRLRKTAPRVVEQVGTPIVSAVAAAVSKARGRYVRLGGSTLTDTKLIVRLNLLEVGSI